MRSLDDLLAGRVPQAPDGVGGRRVLVRCDLNVPLDGSRITDDGRIRASVPTLSRLLDAGARVVVCAHLGRPKGKPDPAYSLRPVAARLAELLDQQVPLADDVAGPGSTSLVNHVGDGALALLENLRFDPGETAKDPADRADLADRLAALADVYVGDAFGAVHRAHASVVDVPQRLPHVAGGLVLDEVRVLQRLTEDPQRPYAVVLGGSKVSDKLGVIDALLDRVDRLLIGGGMCFTFLAAQGHGVGDSLLEPDQFDTVRGLIERAQEQGVELVVPSDVVVAREVSADAEVRTVPVEEIPAGWKGLDIGPQTVRAFAEELREAKTVFWNGPMGVFEVAPFAAGTRGVAGAVAAAPGLSVVGGGDSAAAVRELGLPESSFGHISTGGGASLEYLEGKPLPGLAALED